MQEILTALGLEGPFAVRDRGVWHSRFDVNGLATGSTAAAGLAAASLMEAAGLAGSAPEVVVDQRLAGLWFAFSIDPIDWSLPPVWDAIAGDYRARDGWIKLHTNLPHHRAAACRALGVAPERDAVTAAVAASSADDVEAAVVAEGGVAAAMRSADAWAGHPQGRAIAEEPLIAFGAPRAVQPRSWPGTPTRPLAGLRVLDLTRVLAGPVATRFLASLGATVLRIDPPGWEEANVVPDITLGKHCARLDLRAEADRDRFRALLADADILVHGYRPGAVDGLGFDRSRRAQIAPNAIEVCLDAYGWSGPWSGRRGFDSLVQMSSGIAHAGMAWAGREVPTPLPVQALDHATGMLMAAAVLRSLDRALRDGRASDARLSLARTARLLTQHAGEPCEDAQRSITAADQSEAIEHTPWGPARRLRPALRIGELEPGWDRPASELGSADAAWPA